MKEKRLKDLDMAKGIGIILVVVGHSGMASEAVVTWLASFHMPLFFILSGMLAYHKKEERRPVFYSIKKKARALLVPYAFFSVIYLLIDLYYLIRGREIQLADAVLQTISFSGLSVLWFLPALFIGEILFLSLRKYTSGPVTAVCCCAVCFGCLCLERLCGLCGMPRDSSFFLWLGYLMTALLRGGISAVFPAMGYCVMWLREKTDSFGLSRIWYFAAAVVFFLANYGVICRNGRTDLRYLSFQNPVLYFAGAFLGSMAVVCLCRALPPVRLLSYLGENSLMIMLTHLDCFVMYIAHRFAYFMDRFIPVGKEYMLWLNVALAIFLMEAVIIYVGNRFFPFMLGKSSNRVSRFEKKFRKERWTLRELCRKINIQPEIIRRLEEAGRETDLAQAQPLLEKLMDPGAADGAYDGLREFLGEDRGSIKMLLCQLECAVRIHEVYRKKGIPDEIYIDTMKCFSRFIGECGRKNGELFFDRGWWTCRQISMRLFRIGALEYEFQGNEKEKSVGVHIPSDADFSPASVDDSLGRARAFFAEFYPDYGEVPYTCDSWLLSPALRGLLPEDSHILSFQRRFEITGTDSGREDCLEWLFAVPEKTPYGKLPETTLLQRNAKKLLLEGGFIGCARGILR